MVRFTKFISVGLINTIFCFFLFIFFTNFLNLNVLVSNFLSYIFVIPLSYILYKLFVFQSISSSGNKINYIIAFILSYLGNYLLLITLISFTSLSNQLIHLLGMSAYTLVFYSINNTFVFKDKY